MATFDLGRVTPLYKGDYNASTSYELNDVVLYNGNLYWHIQATATVGILPTDTTVWKLAFADEGVRAEIRGYADNAQASKSAAATSASQASASASNASASASQAASSAQTASTKASEASTSAQTASTKASEATASAQSAATSAQTATDKATLASQKAAAASESASLATAKANAAATSETNAATSATTATTKATEATTAAATAVSAKDDAVSANTAAQSAKTAAQTAQTGAETAAASVQSSAAQIQTNADDISELKEDFTQMESDGVVPSAEQILSDKGVTDSVPYHYRKTGGDGADRLYDQIVGGTVCFNQQIIGTDSSINWVAWKMSLASSEGVIVATAQEDNINDMSVRPNVVNVIQGHKYFLDAYVMASEATTKTVFTINDSGFTNWTPLVANTWTRVQTVNSAYATSTAFRLFADQAGGHEAGFTVKIKNYMLFDLTAMFGPTIADYIYSLEQATAGAGVALFKSLFPKDYYAYDAGSMQSVSGLSEHRTVGKNLIDVTATTTTAQGVTFTVNEDKSITANGTSTGWQGLIVGTIKAPAGDYVFIDGLNDSSYFLEIIVNGQSYDTRYTARKEVTLVSDSEITVKAYVASGATINSLTMYPLFCRADVDDSYEPYNGHTYALDDSLTLRGVPKLVDGKVCFDGDTYDADGTVTRRYSVVDLGTLTWTYSATVFNGSFSVQIPTLKANTALSICSKYESIDGTNVASLDKVIYTKRNGITIYVKDSAYTDATTFKTAMSGVMLVYELATPTTENADPYQHLQQCGPNGTEEYVSTGIVPIGHNSFYPENLRAKVEQLPWNFANLIAPTESTFTATRNYTTGSLFIVDNVLYKATANIANGGTITPNTNCTATTLAEIISALA